jgi:hypothetical protein
LRKTQGHYADPATKNRCINEFQELPAFSVYILELFDIKTTEHYLHVAKEKLVYIASPLDYLRLHL